MLAVRSAVGCRLGVGEVAQSERWTHQPQDAQVDGWGREGRHDRAVEAGYPQPALPVRTGQEGFLGVRVDHRAYPQVAVFGPG
jgi:hypothetical protein